MWLDCLLPPAQEAVAQAGVCFASLCLTRTDVNQIEMIPVVSSNIAAIGYSDSSSVLQVDFLNGTRYRYFDVPPQVFTAFLVSRSKGRYFNTIIKSDSAFDYLQVK